MKTPKTRRDWIVFVTLLVGFAGALVLARPMVAAALRGETDECQASCDEESTAKGEHSCACGKNCDGGGNCAAAKTCVNAEKCAAEKVVAVAEKCDGAETADRSAVPATPLIPATPAVPATLVVATSAEQAGEQTSAAKESVLFSVLKALVGRSTSSSAVPEEPDSGEEVVAEPTHKQTSIIAMRDAEGNGAEVHTFCLDEDGRILAGCGSEPGEIRVFESDGQFVAKWEVPVTPDAVSVAPDGTICVAGDGQLVRLSAQGEVVRQAEAPHFAAINANVDKIREQIVSSNKQMAERYAQMCVRLEEQIATIKEQAGDEPLDEAAERRLKVYADRLAVYRQAEERFGGNELPEEQVEQRVEQMKRSKMRVASVSATDNDVFVTCGAQEGYGFDVWRMNSDFADGKQIVTGLRGCCGQMDVKVNANGVYVAENARHRVCCFDHDGEEVCTWGKGDRSGDSEDGFGSCCNPMNVAFGPGASVYTAESTTGRIKRFSADGKFLELIGQVELVPGCKNVSIAVSSDGDQVYMLDITRDHIVAMQRKPITEPADSTVSAPTAQETAGG